MINLEIGKFYETRKGEKFKILGVDKRELFIGFCENEVRHFCFYTNNGRVYPSGATFQDNDIIAECKEPDVLKGSSVEERKEETLKVEADMRNHIILNSEPFQDLQNQITWLQKQITNLEAHIAGLTENYDCLRAKFAKLEKTEKEEEQRKLTEIYSVLLEPKDLANFMVRELD